MSRVKIYWIGVIVVYTIIIFNTRKPDYFTGKFVKGKVINPDRVTRYIPPSLVDTLSVEPVVAYRVDGVDYVFRDDVAIWPPVFKEGEEVTIIYDPKDPEHAYLYWIIGYWLNITELFIGVLLSGIPYAVYLAKRRLTTREEIAESLP